MLRLRGEIHEALTWGGLALRLKGRRTVGRRAEREVSRGRSSESTPSGMATRLLEDGEESDIVKGRTKGRANQP